MLAIYTSPDEITYPVLAAAVYPNVSVMVCPAVLTFLKYMSTRSPGLSEATLTELVLTLTLSFRIYSLMLITRVALF